MSEIERLHAFKTEVDRMYDWASKNRELKEFLSFIGILIFPISISENHPRSKVVTKPREEVD